ncbi:YitT family protein [Leuconostoc gelidum]|uniref:YitT family protein n=1 Tax=Leuconostoc gelidum subsp. gelidum TaxID=1607839 RepID=A0AB35G0A6_LEUGE|nr:YitT family protein [Leuconostoc gelidum]MBZ5963711.1 YitT family protein [Leuconostoc gelidum subsp. gelidum]MBZ5975446.1 YitT family protein [Leuconostoc gelidum subsp. gelidum]MBZ5976383.1 YitT family protein [Leuconostoc gelidum subsp. gelidum]MBZ5978473.1 YitT family protein [Leuconostoc gelidum subsp. gelidum]MBZ5987168.1 YitT family protein [Leuconostoc gelidum subsp. gelidum]
MQKFFHNFMKHRYTGRVGGAIFYAVIVAVAMNYFWRPGHIYSSGFTGFAQLVSTLTGDKIPVALALALVNLPMLIIAWWQLSWRFATFTTLAVLLSAALMPLFDTTRILTPDPLINALFGGALNGMAVGTALRYGVGTGGLDVIGLLVKKRFGLKMGPVNLGFNALIMIGAGLTYGWKYALYSIVGVIVSSRMIDAFFTRQQQMQVMIITTKPEEMVQGIYDKMRRGVTIINDAHGGYTGEDRAVLLTVITQQERFELREAIKSVDDHAFSSTWKIEHTVGRFYEPEL